MQPVEKIYDERVFAVVLGKLITQLRERQGLTQGALAAQLGVSQPVLSRIETGTKPPDIVMYGRIATALGATKEELDARVRDVMERTKEAAQGATKQKVQPPNQTWTEAVKVAGWIGLMGLIVFALAAVLSELEGNSKGPSSPPKPGPKPKPKTSAVASSPAASAKG